MPIYDAIASSAAAEARSTNTKNFSFTAKDEFWDFAEINETHWNKSYPYQLVILRRDGDDYKTTDTFTLPINPSELSISSPFAITTSVTLGGVVEEHNGSPLKLISIQGSTGFNPLRGSPDTAQSFGSKILGGSLAGIRKVADGIQQIASGGLTIQTPNLMDDSALNKGTGYYQFMLLRNFLESYAALKKTSKGAPYRLAFTIWKDTEAWLVTPVSFDLRRSNSSPLEYSYSIQLKAWKRYSPTSSARPVPAFKKPPLVQNPNAMAAALNSFRGARNVLLGVKSVLTGFRADVDATLFLPLRETGMFIKAAIGVGLTAMDLPGSIIKDFKNSVLELTAKTPAPSLAQIEWEIVRDLAVISGIAENGADPSAKSHGTKRQDLDLSNLGPNEAHPANKIFDNPDHHPAFFNSIQVGSLNLRPAVAKKIVQERERVQKLTRADFERFRDDTLRLAADYADSVGAGAATYSTIYNRPQPVATRTPTDDDWEVLFQLNTVATEFSRLAASTATDTKNQLSAMEYLAGQAQRSGIPFKVPASAFAVPFPYGSTLEIVSNRYLGTPDRWHEIAALNNLRPPYVDEEGFTLPLLVNGSGNSIQVSDGTNLYLGQPVWLSSGVVSREKRRVTGLRSLSPSIWVVSLDGLSDLSRFTTAAGAEMYAFLPGTANSLQLIYIPSDEPPADPDYEPKGNESIDEFDTFLGVGGVDLMLTDRGGLAIGPDGDCRLAIGLANIVQHVKLVLGIEPGTLLHHPDIGFAVRPGTSTADVTAKDLLQAARQSFANDRTFTGVGAASIVKNGPSVNIALSLGIAGISHFIPVSFAIGR